MLRFHIILCMCKDSSRPLLSIVSIASIDSVKTMKAQIRLQDTFSHGGAYMALNKWGIWLVIIPPANFVCGGILFSCPSLRVSICDAGFKIKYLENAVMDIHQFLQTH